VEGGDARPPGLWRCRVEAAFDADGGRGKHIRARGHILVTYVAFFKPPATVFLSELDAKDRRSANEWEYIDAVGVWLELGQAAMAMARNGEDENGGASSGNPGSGSSAGGAAADA
jgi:hypothetical protein